MNDVRWRTREEWAAQAEYFVRTACMPEERVPAGAEHYLTPDEVDEMQRLDIALSKATRAVLTREIQQLRATFQGIPSKKRERVRWFLALSDSDQERYSRLRDLEDVRADLTRIIAGRPARRGVRHGLSAVVEMVPDRPALDRLRALGEKCNRLRNEAACRATEEAVAKEVARRQTDEAWERELKRRARPAVTVVEV